MKIRSYLYICTVLCIPVFAYTPASAESISGTAASKPALSGSREKPQAKDSVYLGFDLDGAKNETSETNAGDLVADAVKEAAHTDIAWVSADDLMPAKITSGTHPISELLAILKYGNDTENRITILNLKGSQILGAIERSLSRYPTPFDGFLQVSGLEIEYQPSQSAGSRVFIAGTRGTEIVADKVYRVAMSKSVAEGAYGYFKIWKSSDIDRSSDVNTTIAAALTAYLSKHNTISPVVEGRIKTPAR